MTHSTIRRLSAFAVVVLIVGAAAALSACRDEIPAAPPTAEQSPGALEDGSIPAAAALIGHQERQHTALHFGASVQTQLPWSTAYYVSYSVFDGDRLGRQIVLQLSCDSQRRLSIHGLHPASEANRTTLLVLIDELAVQAVDVTLQRFESDSPEGQRELATVQLDEAVWYDQLRGAERLTVQLLRSEAAPVTFDLTQLFSTTFQDTFDQCSDASVADLSG